MNIINLPNYLNIRDINSWVNSVNNWLQSFFQAQYKSSFRSDLDAQYTLEFSDELIEENCEAISLEEAKKTILRTWPLTPNDDNDRSVEELIDRIRNAQTLDDLKHCVSHIAEIYVDENGERNYQRTRDQIEELLGRTVVVGEPYKLYILGRYDHARKTIVLYERAINISKRTPRLQLYNAGFTRTTPRQLFNFVFRRTTPLHLFKAVFAHEVFHAYHYYICVNRCRTPLVEIENRTDYTSKVVKESLAAFFEYYYCSKNMISTDINSDWRSNSVGFYPYSGAKYLLPLSTTASPLFLDVFNTSIDDFDQALRKLLSQNMRDFYLVKNLKEVIKMAKAIKKTKDVRTPRTARATGKPTDAQIERWLTTMAKWWFILKYAKDHHGITTSINPDNYGAPGGLNRRLSTYRQTAPYHVDMIYYLKRKPLGPNVRVGNGGNGGTPSVSRNELQDILDKLP